MSNSKKRKTEVAKANKSTVKQPTQQDDLCDLHQLLEQLPQLTKKQQALISDAIDASLEVGVNLGWDSAMQHAVDCHGADTLAKECSASMEQDIE